MKGRVFSSLRSRLVYANLAMLLPLFVLTAISYVTYERILRSYDEVLAESLRELKPIRQLEYHILSATTPLHGYLIHATRDELERFRVTAARVDSLFRSARQLSSLKQEQRVILRKAESEWKDNLRLAEKIMNYEPPFEPESAVMMELFDLRLAKINNRLRTVRDYVDAEIIALNETAKQRHDESLQIYSYIFLFSTLAAITVGILVGKSITRPLKELEKAANEFTAGNMSYRIRSTSSDEVGRLSRTFDAMAREIESLVIQDPLTGLLNKREFEKRFNHEIERAARYSKPLSLLMFDIDHFKKVNDEYGHQVGDLVLKQVSSMINRQTRSIDHLARYGGEELVLILPEIDKNAAMQKAEKIRESISQEKFTYGQDEFLRITISVGVATYNQDAPDGTELVAAADTALYVAKNNGRNRVEGY